MAELLYREESYRIVGACFEVYKSKGCGFTEPIYQECLAIEFALQGIPFVAQALMELDYKGRRLEHNFRVDFICFDSVLVELKAVTSLVDAHRAQVLNYLHANRFRLPLLVNFGHHPRLEYERLVL